MGEERASSLPADRAHLIIGPVSRPIRTDRLARSVARTAARSIVLLVLAFAPLACLRFCQLSHLLAQHTHGDPALIGVAICASASLGNSADALPAEGGLMRDIQRMLTGLTEFVPAIISLTALMITCRRTSLSRPVRLTHACDIPTPPPRPRFIAS